MPSLIIPDRYHTALKELLQLSEKGVEELAAALSAAPLSRASREIAKAIEGQISEIPSERLPAIVDAILALYLVRAQAEVPLESFIKDLVPALPELPQQGDRTGFKRRLKTLLSIEALSTIAKAVNLSAEYAETYCSARVLTDLRPVWRQSRPEAPPVGAVVTHTLKIEYHHGTVADHRELYVGLDSDDVSELIKVLQRAQKKEKSLKDLMANSKISNLRG